MSAPSVLDDATLDRLRAQAVALAAGPFVDPHLLRQVPFAAGWRAPEWLERVTGQAHVTARTADYKTAILVVLASRADTTHLGELDRLRRSIRDWHARRQAEEARRDRLAKMEAWTILRARIPVTVQVWHNWYGRAHAATGNQWSADHIVVMTDFQAGRLRREKGTALCQTRADDPRFRHVTPNGVDHERVPTCKRCLRIAERWKP